MIHFGCLHADNIAQMFLFSLRSTVLGQIVCIVLKIIWYLSIVIITYCIDHWHFVVCKFVAGHCDWQVRCCSACSW